MSAPYETQDECAARFERDAMPLRNSLYGHAMRETHNPADAEDLVQDTLIRAYLSFHQFTPPGNLSAWLHRLMTNQHIDNVRKAKALKRPQISEDEPEEWQGAHAESHTSRGLRSAEDVALDARVDSIITEALDGLVGTFRTVVFLYDVWGYSQKEIAEIMGTPIGTVMSRLCRAHAQLREELRDYATERGFIKALERTSK